MEKQPDDRKTVGQAIDELIHALSSIDEAGQVTAIRAACELLKIPLFGAVTPSPPPGVGGVPPGSGGHPPSSRINDVKTFRNEKQPSSANEMAALVAFYLSELAPEAERKSEVETEDMVKYFKQAGFPLPKQPRMLLTNAKNSGYFDSGGAGGYKLNAVGYNLVAHNLPRAASAATMPPRRKPREKTRKRGLPTKRKRA